MIFQSLAPQFNFNEALKHLFSGGEEEDANALKNHLLEKYEGKSVELYGKGRAALAEAVRIATSGEGRVLVTGLTCNSVEQAVTAAGCRPIFVDISYKDLQFSKKSLTKAFEDYSDIKAIIIQNTLGVPADISFIKQIARTHNIVIIEDLAHSIGSKYLTGSEMGTVGDITMLSFGRDKAVDVTNGGAIILRKEFNHRIRKPHNMPSSKNQTRDRIYPLFANVARFLYPIGLGRFVIAWFYKSGWAVKSADGKVNMDIAMTNWQAKDALEKLQNIEQTVKHRQKITKKIYDEIDLSPITSATYENASIIRVPFVVENRHEVLQALKSEGIFLEDVWYDSPVSPRRYLKDSSFVRSEAPNAIKISNEIINIPTYKKISPSDVEKIALIINRTAKDVKH